MSQSYDPATGLNFGGNPSDQGVFCEFYNEAVENASKSNAEGRVIFDDEVYVRIRLPGDRLNEVCRRAKDDDKRRFPIQWALFQQGQTVAQSGTPLEQWPPMTPATIRTFKAQNVFTVEALAAVTDGHLSNLGMGSRKFRDMAMEWLAKAQEGAAHSKLAAENEDLRQKLQAAEANLADLASAVRRLEAKDGAST